MIIMAMLLAAAGLSRGEDTVFTQAISILLVLTYFWMLLASHCKRWHDLGRSGWWQLVALIPFGGLYELILCGCIRGDTGPNRYGPDPLADHDIREYSKDISFNPNDALARVARGTALALKGEYDRAMADLDAAVGLNPNDHEAFNSRAYVHFRLGHLESAIADYDRAVALNPKSAEALFGRGVLKLRMANQDGGPDVVAAKAIDPNIAERMALLSLSV
jgi:tetratricopeptide (TPR) repeat protein